MPKLDLTTARQIKGAAGEILALKGAGFTWTKPVSAVLRLDQTPAALQGLEVVSASDTTLEYRSTVQSRRFIGWALPALPVGTTISFAYQAIGASLWCRTATDSPMTQIVDEVLPQTFPGTGSASKNLTTSRASYFGFLIGGSEPANATHRISNFQITLP